MPSVMESWIFWSRDVGRISNIFFSLPFFLKTTKKEIIVKIVSIKA
jgi:hypothetical protein